MPLVLPVLIVITIVSCDVLGPQRKRVEWTNAPCPVCPGASLKSGLGMQSHSPCYEDIAFLRGKNRRCETDFSDKMGSFRLRVTLV